MDDVTLIVSIQGYIFPNRNVAREISWVHKDLGICETISVFTPDYEMNDQERAIVRKVSRDVHGLRFKRYPDDKGLWISDDEVKEYLQQLYRLYGGKFGFKGGIIDVETFNEWGIPTVFFSDIPKCVQIKGPGCSMYRCIYYKNYILKNNYEIND